MKSHNRSTKEIEEALASLQLPQMPRTSDRTSAASITTQQQHPTITILVVADIDLLSASALSEYTLEHHLSVDLCIACGSFSRDEDLHPYLRGKQRRKDRDRAPVGIESGWSTTPFFRTREQTSALEGLMTATLSQLENIVCRVVYCPGSSDPLTCLVNDRNPRRLTPNSRSLHNQWLPLAPGLGAAALLYLDCSDKVIRETREGFAHWESYNRGDDNDEDEDEEVAFWVEQLQQLQQNCKGYCTTLERLLKLAPPVEHAVPFVQHSQTILVTHYVDCTPLLASNSSIDATGILGSDNHEDPNSDYMPTNGTPLWALEKEDKPWPVEHAIFHASTLTRQRLCLEIASGSPSQYKPELVNKGKSTILLPGSLRERGEFSVVHVSLQETTELLDEVNELEEQHPPVFRKKKKKTKPAFSWVVKNVDFYKLSERKA